MLGMGVGAGDREVMESLSSEDLADTHTHTRINLTRAGGALRTGMVLG